VGILATFKWKKGKGVGLFSGVNHCHEQGEASPGKRHYQLQGKLEGDQRINRSKVEEKKCLDIVSPSKGGGSSIQRKKSQGLEKVLKKTVNRLRESRRPKRI